MTRFEDWPGRLYDYALDPANAVFAWGKNDCVMYCANAIRAITGEDPLSGFVDAWSTEDEALAVLDARGGLLAAVSGVLGPPMDNVALAQRGDIALVELPDMDFLALHLGDRLVAPTKDRGLVQIKSVHAKRAWAVGR